MGYSKRYCIDGHYTFQGKENPFSGFLDMVDERVAGMIKDPNSRCPEWRIEGKIESDGDERVLTFTKMPSEEFKSRFAPIEYQLRKASKGLQISGGYFGAWRLANPELCGRVGIAYPHGEPTVIWIPQRETANRADLILQLR